MPNCITSNHRNKSGAIYVITYHAFNHEQPRLGRKWPLDPRFLNSSKNHLYYLIDKEIPPVLKDKPTILEHALDPVLYDAGAKHFGEWSFLLAEAKHAFCQYPLFMISSRFYEKNRWLQKDLTYEWDSLFSHLHRYKFGYLPSYDRPLRWVDLEKIQSDKHQYPFYPFTLKTYDIVESLFDVRIPQHYRFTADLFCNYIGFKSRQELLSYVEFYRPLIDFFFDDSYQLKRDLSPYIRSTGMFRNEKPFTFLLELFCHLYFFKKKIPYFSLHYDGYYLVDEAQKTFEKLSSFPLSRAARCSRFLDWQWRKANTEGFLRPVRARLRNYPLLHKGYRAFKSLIK